MLYSKLNTRNITGAISGLLVVLERERWTECTGWERRTRRRFRATRWGRRGRSVPAEVGGRGRSGSSRQTSRWRQPPSGWSVRTFWSTSWNRVYL